MTQDCSQCPLSATIVRFIGYSLFGEFLSDPESDNASEHLILRYRFENPDPSIAREKLMHKIKAIKNLMEKGAGFPDYKYKFQGLHLDTEFEVIYPDTSEGDTRTLRKIRILDGNPVSEDDLQKRLQMLDDLMEDAGLQFDGCDVEEEDEANRC
jgi:hypothetical protein